MIRVLQASAWYPPSHLGGTEIYVSGLVKALRDHNISSRVVAPLGSEAADGYLFDGTTVRTYTVNSRPSRAELRAQQHDTAFDKFCALLNEERPDVYHQHSWSRGLGGAHLPAARSAGLRTVLTVHTPDNICMRGTMMQFGERACDGRIDTQLCAACWGEGRGAPKQLAHMLGAMPRCLSVGVERLSSDGRVMTALSARALSEQRKEEFLRMVDDADRVVAVCGWLYEALRINQIPENKLLLSRQGVDTEFADRLERDPPPRSARADRVLRVIYVGRWHRVKGIDVLVRAVRKISADVPVSLAIHGVGDGPEERACADEIRALAGDDNRIRIDPPVARSLMHQVMGEADVLAVPSLWLETGPLVVLEAKAAGLPVLGSRLGGIAELVRETEDGMLVAPGDVDAWAAALTMMATAGEMRHRPRIPTETRTMRAVATEMAMLYRSLI